VTLPRVFPLGSFGTLPIALSELNVGDCSSFWFEGCDAFWNAFKNTLSSTLQVEFVLDFGGDFLLSFGGDTLSSLMGDTRCSLVGETLSSLVGETLSSFIGDPPCCLISSLISKLSSLRLPGLRWRRIFHIV
jgi:hypothetical protein